MRVMADERSPVVIVGAGPTGLSLALGLARHGTRSTLLEREPMTSEWSKAGGVHLRTREIFRRWGVEEQMVEAGHLVARLTFRDAKRGDRPFSSIDFSVLEDEADRPGILTLPQSRTEELLLEAVCESGMSDVRFGAEAVDVTQDEHGATVTVRESGDERHLRASFVAGCDGPGSTVREVLGLPFEGITYSIRPLLADVLVDEEHDALPWPRFFNAPRGLMFGVRLASQLWRVVRLDRDEPDMEVSEEVTRLVCELLGLGQPEVVWASRFRIHRRAAPRFRIGRVVLAGDAAHVHSPAGGQGMNSGIQDADNLAWKLAYALRGGDVGRLLDSYDVERRAVVVGNVSRYTDLLTRVFLETPATVRRVAFAIQGWLVRLARVQRANARRVGMIDLDYPATSPLLDGGEGEAGKRLPNPLMRSADGGDVRLYDLLPTGAALLDVGGNGGLGSEVPVDDVIRVGVDGYRDPSASLRGLLSGETGWILVRPDSHVAWARSRDGAIDDAVRHALGGVG